MASCSGFCALCFHDATFAKRSADRPGHAASRRAPRRFFQALALITSLPRAQREPLLSVPVVSDLPMWFLLLRHPRLASVLWLALLFAARDLLSAAFCDWGFTAAVALAAPGRPLLRAGARRHAAAWPWA